MNMDQQNLEPLPSVEHIPDLMRQKETVFQSLLKSASSDDRRRLPVHRLLHYYVFPSHLIVYVTKGPMIS